MATTYLGVALGATIGAVVALGWSILGNTRQAAYNRLQHTNLAMALLHLLSSVILAWLAHAKAVEFGNIWAAPTTLSLSTWENTTNVTCGDGGACYLRITSTPQSTIHVGILCILFGMISGLGHLYLFGAETDQNRIERMLLSGHNPVRWMDYAVSSALMIVVIGTVTGITEVFVLAAMAQLQFFFMVVSNSVEHKLAQYVTPSPPIPFEAVGLYGLMCVLYVTAVWTPVFVQFYYPRDTFNPAPSWVNVIIWALFLAFSSFGVCMYVFLVHPVLRHAPRSPQSTTMLRQELTYAALSLIAKVLLQWLLFIGIFSRTGMLYASAAEAQPHTSDNLTPVLSGVAVAIVLGGVALWFALQRYVLRHYQMQTFASLLSGDL